MGSASCVVSTGFYFVFIMINPNLQKYAFFFWPTLTNVLSSFPLTPLCPLKMNISQRISSIPFLPPQNKPMVEILHGTQGKNDSTSWTLFHHCLAFFTSNCFIKVAVWSNIQLHPVTFHSMCNMRCVRTFTVKVTIAFEKNDIEHTAWSERIFDILRSRQEVVLVHNK
jgi:hypothetical protein